MSLFQPVGSSLKGASPGMGPLFDDSIEASTEVEGFPVDWLIPDLVYHIFTFLPPRALTRASSVSKVWQDLASRDSIWNAIDPKQIPRVTVLDQACWEEHVDLSALELDFNDLPAVANSAIIDPLKKLLAPGVIEDDAGATVLIMPNGLDHDKLSTLTQHLKKGHPAQFRDISPEVLRKLQAIPPSRACIFVISNNVLKGSRSKPVMAQEVLMRGVGCGMPEVLPMATLAILTHISSGTRLYGDKPWTCTRCTETMINIGDIEFKLVLGGFALGGLEVGSIRGFARDFVGVGALWKFPAIGT